MSLVVIGATLNIARSAQALSEPIIFVQRSGSQPRDLLRDNVDEFFTIDYRDESKLICFAEQILRPRSPKAVVSVTEDGLEPTALLSDILNTPATPISVVRTMRDKFEMRNALASRAPHLNVAFADPRDRDAVACLFSSNSRAVVKPRNGTGSDGIHLLNSAEEVQLLSNLENSIIEAFVGGIEFSVEAFSIDGSHEVITIVEKGTAANFVEVSHLAPPLHLAREHANLIAHSVAELLDGLGLRNGPTHTELKLDGDTVKIIETHNRPGGDGIADLVEITSGIDWRQTSLGWPLGRQLVRGTPQAPAAASVFFTAVPGKVAKIIDQPKMPDGVSVESWRVPVEVDDIVKELRSSGDRVGGAILSGQSSAACSHAIRSLRETSVVITDGVPA